MTRKLLATLALCAGFEIAEIPLEVAGATLADIKVVTARGAAVSGRLEWGGKGPAPWPRTATTLGSIRATAVGRQTDFAQLDSNIQPDRTFRFTDMYGLRRIQAMSLPFNWMIRSVEGPKEVTAGPNLDIKPGSVVADLKVVVTNRTGWFTAIVADDAGKACWVLLMPRAASDLDALGWGFQVMEALSGPGSRGHFTLERLLPGSYLVVAIDVEPYRMTHDTALMERARDAAVPVEIREGHTTVRLPLVRLRPFVQGPSN